MLDFEDCILIFIDIVFYSEIALIFGIQGERDKLGEDEKGKEGKDREGIEDDRLRGDRD